MSFTNNQTKTIADYVFNSKPTIIFNHRNPDGDTIASTLALQRILKRSNPNVKCGFSKADIEQWSDFLHNLFADELATLAPDDYLPNNFNDYENYQAIMVDFREMSRAENINITRCNDFLAIDHHPWTPKEEINEEFNNPKIENRFKEPSAAQALYHWLTTYIDEKDLLKDVRFLNTITKGILTDTGNFSYKEVDTSGTHGLIQNFLNNNKGFSISKLRLSLNNMSLKNVREKLQMQNFVLENFFTSESNRTAMLVIDEETLNKYGFKELSSITEFLNSISDFEIACIAIKKPTYWRFSLRGKDTPIKNIAVFFGGNGHNFAGGFNLHGKLTKEEVINVCHNIAAHHEIQAPLIMPSTKKPKAGYNFYV